MMHQNLHPCLLPTAAEKASQSLVLDIWLRKDTVLSCFHELFFSAFLFSLLSFFFEKQLNHELAAKEN